MATTTTADVARNLLRNSKSLPQILRGSNATTNLNNMAKDHHHYHQIVQSLFVSNQKIHAQIPIFDFNEMGSLVGSYGELRLAEKSGGGGGGHGMGGLVVEARGKVVMDDDDDINELFEDDDEDDDGDADEDFKFEDDDDDEDEDDDGTFRDVKDKIKI